MSTRNLFGVLCIVAVPGFLLMAMGSHEAANAAPAAPAAQQAALPGQVTTPGVTVVVRKPAANDAVAQQAADDEDGAEGAGDDEDSEESIAVSSVPQAVMLAALSALPGFEAAEAEREQHASGTTYSLEGTVEGKRVEIELTSAGEVLEIEGAEGDG